MFSFLKKFSAICIILSVICAVATVLCLMLIAPSEYVDPTLLICISTFSGCVSVIALILSITLWNLATELSIYADSNFDDISKLKHRVEFLEKR